MGKVLNFLLAAATIAVGIITRNPALIAAGVAQLTSATVNLLFGPKAAKPEAVEAQVKNPTAPRVYGYGTRRLRGALAFWGNGSNGSTVDVINFCEGPVQAIRQAYLNDDKVTVNSGTVQAIGKKYRSGKVKAGWNLGQTPAPVHSAVSTALGSAWTSSHRGDGVVSGYLIKNPAKEDDFIDTYPQGDNVTLSLVIDLQKCFDPRNAAHDINNPATWAWTENPVLHLLHYFVVRRGYNYETKILPQIAKWIAAANICDQIVSGEKRYRSCVLYDSTAKPAEVIGSLLETGDIWYAENEAGQIIVYGGAYYEPTVTIGPDQIVEYEHQAFVEDENIVNELIVKYVSAAHDYNEVEAKPWQDETDISNRGAINSEVFAPQVPSFKQARRLAKINMARNNAPDRGTVVTNYSGRIASGQRFIRLLIVEAGTTIYDGVAEVQRVTRNLETSGLTIEWVRAEPEAWSWFPETEDGYGAPTGTFPVVLAAEPPTITSATYGFDPIAATAAVMINGTGPDRDDLTWFARYRIQGTSAWSEQRYTDVAAGAAVELSLPTVPVDTDLEVQIAYKDGNAKFSGWSDSAFVGTETDTSPPGAASVITLTRWADSIDLTTDRIARADTYRWRFYRSDGTTLVRTIITTSPAVIYTAIQAAADSASRSYVVTVAGVNSAGAGGESSTGVLNLPAPPIVTGVSAAQSSPGNAQVDFTAQTGAFGYVIATSTVSGFDPLSQGFLTNSLVSPAYLQNLAVATYYTKVAVRDAWTGRPDLLNFSTEATFTITATSGGTGGGGGGGGGGYLCPHVDTLLLLANAAHDGPGELKRAGDFAVGDWVWTRPELEDGSLGEWGAFPVSAVTIEEADLWRADVGIAPLLGSGPHRIWVSGWVTLDSIGERAGVGDVVRITVTGAHTYAGNGLIHHNSKIYE